MFPNTTNKTQTMKYLFLIVLLYLQIFPTHSQVNNGNISFDIQYPIPIGNNFINKAFGKGYHGLVDLGIGYNFMKFKNLNVGILFNTSFLNLSRTNVHLNILSPKINLEHSLCFKQIRIINQVGIGYSNWRFKENDVVVVDHPSDIPYITNTKQNLNGYSLKAGSKIVLNSNKKINWYLQLSYEFTKLQKYYSKLTNSSFNRNIQILYPGVGIIWSFN